MYVKNIILRPQMVASILFVEGSVVRRQKSDINAIVGWDVFLDEMQRRGYQVYLNHTQVIVICNQHPLVAA